MLAAGLATIASLAVFASPAFAIYDHSEVENEFQSQTCNEANGTIEDLAVDESQDVIYVYCEAQFNSSIPTSIIKYNFNGEPVNFSAVKGYVSGNQIIGNPGAANDSLRGGFAGPHIAVDNSGGPNEGLIYVFAASSGLGGGSENIQIFRPSGEYAGAIYVPEFGPGDGVDIEVGPDGSVYRFSRNLVSKYNTTYNEVARMYTPSGAQSFGEGSRFTVDNKGAVWLVENGPTKFEPDQIFTNFAAAWGQEQERFTGSRSPYVPYPLTPGTGKNSNRVAVDPTAQRNDLYVSRANRIEVYSEGNATETSYPNAPTFGLGEIASPAIEVTKDHRVVATAPERKVIIFGPGNIIPDVHTNPADVDKVGHEGADLSADVSLDGGTPVTSCELQIGEATSYSLPPVPCSPSSFGSDSNVEAEATGLTTGTQYHYRFTATNEEGTNYGVDRVFTPAYVLKVKTLAAEGIEEHEAMLRGSLDPDGIETSYYFKYGIDEEYGSTTPVDSAGSGSGVVTLSRAISGLPAGKVFHYRIVAENVNGVTEGEDRTVRTASTPDVSGLNATDLTETSATLHAKINPLGYSTTYRFEYGPSPAYGHSIPVPDANIGSGEEAVEVEQTISGLDPGVTYHYRVVATNVPWGTTYSRDTTFDYAPPTCPNDHVRQETASTYLPDCRAYELVSPSFAGAVQLYPGTEAWDFYFEGQDSLSEQGVWPVNTGLATSPPRFTYYGALGSVSGLTAPNLLTPDTYMATRTNSGWVTTLPGQNANVIESPALKECSDLMNLCLEQNYEAVEETGTESEAYLSTASGKLVERLPSISNIIPGANEYKGFRRTSGDFTHYVFSSGDMHAIFGEFYPAVAFTIDGQTSGIGSAYDNDLPGRSITLISKTENGAPIPAMPGEIRPIQFPAISTDGSHVLMLTESSFEANATDNPSPPYHLYMSVGDAIHYDVSKGDAQEFVGMPSDGSSVTFTSAAQLVPQDEDESVDLYRWSEATNELTLLSQGNGAGNTDECSASWIEGCGVEAPNTERRYAMLSAIPFNNHEVPFFQGHALDDVTAGTTGDVYFYSPELLDGTKFGIANQRNLYVARPNGSVEFVATLDKGTEVNRMTISRDGKFAAMLTASQMTSYDNHGFREVYVYNAESGSLECASCNPLGAPQTNVYVSQGGPFMSDDGRAFFTTKDQMVPRDKNGEIADTYEYVGGRPQLVSSGLSAQDYTGSVSIFGLLGKPEFSGLESVSRDGTDVFFSTFATLVDEDHNGQFLKFYDARTSGGFAQPPVNAACEAADECHGVDSSPPPPPTVASGNNLGSTGNVQTTKSTKKKKHRKHKRHHRKNAKKKRAQRRRANRRKRARARRLARQRSHGGRKNG
jgi:hypothetical protein